MNRKAQGVLNDLTIAIEFLTGAVRDLARGYPPNSKEVQTQLDWVGRKVRPLLEE